LTGSVLQLSGSGAGVLHRGGASPEQGRGAHLAADLIEVFEARPYGWTPWATLTFLGRLFRPGKVWSYAEGDPEPQEVIDGASPTSLARGLWSRVAWL